MNKLAGLLVVSGLCLLSTGAWAQGLARIDKSTGQIETLSDVGFTTPPNATEQDVDLGMSATDFVKAKLQTTNPMEWKLTPLTKSVSHDFSPPVLDVKAARDRIKAKLGLTDAEMDDLRNAVQ